MKRKSITTQEFDELFEQEKDMVEFLDLKTAKRHGLETRRVSGFSGIKRFLVL